jgi:hypothetical protein
MAELISVCPMPDNFWPDFERLLKRGRPPQELSGAAILAHLAAAVPACETFKLTKLCEERGKFRTSRPSQAFYRRRRDILPAGWRRVEALSAYLEMRQ